MNTRRSFIIKCSSVFISLLNFDKLLAFVPDKYLTFTNSHNGNFQFIYLNEVRRNNFLGFLKNVFHLYPENKIHELIFKNTQELKSDELVYKKTQNELPLIKEFLGDLTYSLPALMKQKKVMCEQTIQLLKTKKEVNGYLEIGSNGRYYDLLEEKIKINGPIYIVSDYEETYSPIDIIDRGQIKKTGQHLFLNQYKTSFDTKIENNSLDLVCVYIGFHHCPIELREKFIGDIVNKIKPGGFLILRDHDVVSEEMHKVVCLAHDVFNMGTNIEYKENLNELRNFYSLDFIIEFLHKKNLVFQGEKLLQNGDPSKNTLMAFVKN